MPSRWDTEASRPISEYRPGWFSMRLIKGGPMVAAEIKRIEVPDGGIFWTATIDGHEYPPDRDPDAAQQVARIWTTGREISQDEYRYRLSLAAWAKASKPDHPAANPEQPVDLSSMPSIF